MSSKIIFPFLFLCFYSFGIIGQDTIREKDSSIVTFFVEKENQAFSLYQAIDTSLNDLQEYRPIYTLGNTGLPIQDFFTSALNPIGFNYSISPLNSYRFGKENVRYYQTSSPFTELFFLAGAKKEQLFKFIHSQNINERFNVAAGFKRIRSSGFYKEQNTNDNSFFLSSNFQSTTGRYALISNVNYNQLEQSENGGISDDSLFENTGISNRKLYSVNLNSANRITKDKGIYIRQFYKSGYWIEQSLKDSLVVDSLVSRKLIPTGVFSHSFSFRSDSIIYMDNNPMAGFYADVLRDTLTTKDSLYYRTIENDFSYRLLENKKDNTKRIIGAEVSLRHQMAAVKQNEIDTLFNLLMSSAEIYNFSGFKSIRWKVNGAFSQNLRDFEKRDYRLSVNIEKPIGKNNIGVIVSSQKQMPNFIFQNYSSNHFKWDNNFDQTGLNELMFYFKAKEKKMRLSLAAKTYSNYIYFDTLAMPAQEYSLINVYTASLNKDFIFGKWSLNNELHYQYLEDFISMRLPALIAKHSVFYQNRFFKGALNAQIGVDVNYFSSFWALAYMPATGMFHLQNEKKIGNYPYVDLFINMKIKSARIFLKMEHINAGFLSGTNYYMVPHYPFPDRAFKFGISWKFNN